MTNSLLHTGLTALFALSLGACATNESSPGAQGGMPSKAESDCLAAVANQVNNGDVSTISVTQGETATKVLVRVPGAQAPWQCNHDGSNVREVFYTSQG